MERYNRHIILSDVGQEGQNKLLKAKVLIVGAGGLGCPVLQYLTAAGVGSIGIIDFDVVEESNLQRQILFGTSSLGKNKSIAAKERLADLNPSITINAYPEKLTLKNALDLFKNYDIIVDGTDNFSTRYLINDGAIITNKPIVYGAIYKFEGQVSVFNYTNGPSYRCLFPNPPKEGSVANCSEIGVLGVLPGIIGTMQANEVIKIILGFKDVLSGKLLCYNSKTTETSILKINRVDSEFERVLSNNTLLDSYDIDTCINSAEEISVEDLIEKDNVMFIDVRESHEQPDLNLPTSINIPLNQLTEKLDQINSRNTNVFVCQSGVRSKKAVLLAQEHHIKTYSLKGGISELVQLFKMKI
ncbi:HesA/MoeB/ThiF family protein [Yeosuana sp. MJ-SS3]|uniref:HesA/MoeB/ThiF family protein n=1 Tax=Gilvirhabdus luticola TaxID=3079858 RepID=A0ABU3U3Z5_9FLAO|nr:HesA/MoeB/ThiF family protein [Yeosuana sp. MJ-SS3]MDU8885071.1 HesA/MoeB/ThiF family protein [Yeosuana sp. MJ-SS3]